jgi:ABC-type transporter Mla subunit MlaD
MADESRNHDPLADVINLLAAPIAGGIRTVEQFRRGVDELFRAADNLNRTMENLNEAANRINTFLASIEEPVQALIPQVTRTIKTVDELTALMEGPLRASAPNVERIVNALGSPAFLAVPQQLGELLSRLGPLAQLAENAGGLFGGFRLPGMSRPAQPSARPGAAPTRDSTPATPAKKSPAKHAPAKQLPAKKASRPKG